jgi:hypothetical protein
MTDLATRLEALGTIVLRGDFERWVRSCEDAGRAGRAELATVLNPPWPDLVAIVDDYGADLVLKSIEQIRLGVWNRHHAARSS